jgi:hypothetical protein
LFSWVAICSKLASKRTCNLLSIFAAIFSIT